MIAMMITMIWKRPHPAGKNFCFHQLLPYLAVLILGILLVACDGISISPPQSDPNEFRVVVIGKSVHPYWSNIENLHFVLDID